MTFWGVEVKPGKPFTLVSEDLNGSLILTQATLGNGSSSKKSTLQVRVGEKKPINVCTLLPEISECFTLNLEFEEEDDVEFSVVGPTSIHLSGYVQRPEHDDEDCELDCCGEDIAETDSEDIESEDEDDYEEDFINDEDMPSHSSSTAKKTEVVIEEIEDDDKPVSAKGGSKKEKKEKKKKKKKKLLVPLEENVVDGKTDALELESEDEDGFPLSASGNGESRFAKLQASTKTKIAEETEKIDDDVRDGKSAGNLKRNADAMDQDEEPKCDAIAGDAFADKKKKNKKNKKAKTDKDETGANVKENAVEVATVKPIGEKEDKKISQAVKETKQSKDKPSKIRTYSNGLVVEQLEMGKPDGKRASAGKKISVRYVGKLKQNGETFDASKTPFKFRLGIGQVIKGWDVGVEGMRVGDKRRLTVPPAMGYGSDGAPPTIPPNAWLVFDVELVDVA